MAGPWEKYADSGAGPWAKYATAPEKATPAEDTSPGMQFLKDVGSNAVGLGEAGLQTASGLAAMPYAAIIRMKDEFNKDIPSKDKELNARKSLEFNTYQPRTDAADKYSDAIGEGMNQLFPGLMVAHTMPPIRSGAKLPAPGIGERAKANWATNDKLGKLDEAPVPPPVAPKPPVQGDLFGGYGFNEQQMAESKSQDTHPGQPDLFGPLNVPRSEGPWSKYQAETPAPLDTTAQHPLFDQSEQGRVANPYEAATGDWKIDENGMPYKDDLSTDVQNASQPLQRNLFGDELPQRMNPVGQGADLHNVNGQQAGIPLPEAIDSMPWAQRRGAIKSELTGDVSASDALEGAKAEANSTMRIPPSQRGAINMDALIPGYEKEKMINGGIRLRFQGGFEQAVTATDRYGKELGKLNLLTDDWQPTAKSNMEGGFVGVIPEARRKGLAKEMYKFVSELGNDIIPSKTQLDDGKAMWQGFEKQGLSKGMRIPASQRGAVDLNAFKSAPDSTASLTPDHPAVIEAAKALLQQKREAVVNKIVGNPYNDNITTPEQVVAAAQGVKDIGAGALARMKTVTSGINSSVLSSNNPLLKFARWALRQSDKGADQMAEHYITGKNGIVNKWRGLSNVEQNEVMGVLMKQDSKQTSYTPEQLKDAGFNDKQIAVIAQQKEMEAVKIKVWNAALESTGHAPIEPYDGHFPGVFSGDYRTMVFNKDNHPVGYVGTNTKWGHDKVVNDLKAKLPDHTFEFMGRKSLGKMTNNAYSTGMSELVKVIAEHDPEFAEMQKQVDTLVSSNADKLYGANLHALGKKGSKEGIGIFGSEGNKPWEDKTTNTKEAFQAYTKYWDEGMRSHLNLPVETQLKGLIRNPSIDMPNAKNYLEAYMQHATGRSVGDLGKAFDLLLDAPFKAAGMGPSVARRVVNETTKRVGQKLMGYANLAHTAVQFLQVPTMSVPEFVTIAHQFDVPVTKLATSQAVGTRLVGSFLSGKEVADPYHQAALDFAQKMGMGHFSEFQDMSKVGQGKVGRVFDDVVDMNRKLPEITTRPFTFFTLADMLKDNMHLTEAEKLNTAYNATQEAMIDYSPREKPMVYGSLGQMGKLTGSLSTFKHGAFAQTGRFFKEAAKGNVAPLATTAAAMVALAGVRGIWGYDDADTIVKSLTGMAGNRRSIRELLLDPNVSSEVIKSGALSAYTNLDLAGRVSINGMIPQSVPEAAVGPFGGDLMKVGEAALETTKGHGSIAWKNLATTLMPNGPLKGVTRETLLNNPDTDRLADKHALPGNNRTKFDKAVNAVGVQSLDQSNLSTSQYNDQRREIDKKDRQKDLVTQAQMLFAQGELTEAKNQELLQKFIENDGVKNQWVSRIKGEAVNMNLDKQTRIQGIPKPGNLGSLYQYQNYQRSRKYYNAN